VVGVDGKIGYTHRWKLLSEHRLSERVTERGNRDRGRARAGGGSETVVIGRISCGRDGQAFAGVERIDFIGDLPAQSVKSRDRIISHAIGYPELLPAVVIAV